MGNRVKHWTAESFGNTVPPLNVDDICNAANRMLDAFAETGATPDEIDAYSAKLWDEYCTMDEINGIKSVWC